MIIEIFNIIAIIVFAFTGFIVAGKKNMDIFGVIVVGEITALAGGTLRDMLIPRTIIWISHVEFLFPAIVAGIIFFFLGKRINFQRRGLLYLDAAGVALFSISGSQIASLYYTDPIIIITLGLTTGIVGGVLRDIICNEVPVIFQKDLYAVCIIFGCIVYVVLIMNNFNESLSMGISMLLIFITRALAIKYSFSLPGYSEFNK